MTYIDIVSWIVQIGCVVVAVVILLNLFISNYERKVRETTRALLMLVGFVFFMTALLASLTIAQVNNQVTLTLAASADLSLVTAMLISMLGVIYTLNTLWYSDAVDFSVLYVFVRAFLPKKWKHTLDYGPNIGGKE